ncbi:MAG TPA: ABC transporter ATP-binding protein [Acidimicrobiia bacterium]|nr:ABC transporter ATP-binding protein [Acidimicrobiia bacterium]
MVPVRAYLRLLRRYLRPLRARVMLLSAVLLTGIACQAVNPQLIRAFIDRATSGGSRGGLLTLAAGFTALAVSHQILNVAATYIAEQVGWRATNELRADLADHLLRLDMGFHKGHTPGELIERVDGDVTTLSDFFASFVIRVLGNLVLVVAVLSLLWRESVWVGLTMTGWAVLVLVGMLAIQTVAIPWWKAMRARSAEFFGFLGEQLAGTEDVRASGGVPFMMHRFTRVMRAWLPEQVRARMGFAALWGWSILTYLIVGMALVFWLGWQGLQAGTLTIGAVYLVFHYSDMMREPLEQIRRQMEVLQKAGAGIARVEDLLALRSRLEENGRATLPGGPLSVEFRRVSFAYRDDESNGETVLQGVDLALAPGRVLGVLGRTGSGKSTMARLLTRLYDPGEGEVAVGGTPLPALAGGALRSRVAMVTQEVQLFRGSVRDNLTFFAPGGPDERLWEVLFSLGIGDWAAALPSGLDTILETGSAGLSAGQAQLLAFARVFLRDPGLVILDEASSRLDPVTETLIERAVDRLLAGRTGVIIAHRLATVERADDILILEAGRVAEWGPRAALAADPASRFSALLRTGMEEVLA